MLDAQEVAKHNSRESCWVIIGDHVFDVTDFLDDHPGGPNIILTYGGKDATEEYDPIHPKGTIEKYLPNDKHLGPIDPATIIRPETTSLTKLEPQNGEQIPLPMMMNLNDFEEAAKRKIPTRTFAYFHSAADDLRSFRSNLLDWEKVSLRPRVLRNVTKADMHCTIMGQPSEFPFFICPAARARLANEDGELCLARGAARWGIPYCVSSYSSVAHDELMASLQAEKKSEAGSLTFQLYVQKTREATITMIQMARDLGYKALVPTVDTPVLGKREEDERYAAQTSLESGVNLAPATGVTTSGSDPIVLRGAHSYTLNWEDLTWIREAWGPQPIILKGIQTAEDALLAADADVQGIILSNHGGRQVDDGPSSIRTLVEIHKFCPQVLQKIDIYMDGGVRRGSDVVKGICLGAKGVGLGRPFMYALGAYGTDGVERMIQLLKEEVETTMRLIGATSLSELSPDYVNYSKLEQEMPYHVTALKRMMKSRL